MTMSDIWSDLDGIRHYKLFMRRENSMIEQMTIRADDERCRGEHRTFHGLPCFYVDE